MISVVWCFQIENDLEAVNKFPDKVDYQAGFDAASKVLLPIIVVQKKDILSTRTQCILLMWLFCEYFSNIREKILFKQINSFLCFSYEVGCYFRFKKRYFQQDFDLLIDDRGWERYLVLQRWKFDVSQI